MTPFVAAELVLALVVLLVVGALTFVWARRASSPATGARSCSARGGRAPAGRWRLGLARLGSDRFEWFSIVGPSLRPEVSWLRGELDFGAAVPLRRPDPRARRPGGRAGRGPGRRRASSRSCRRPTRRCAPGWSPAPRASTSTSPDPAPDFLRITHGRPPARASPRWVIRNQSGLGGGCSRPPPGCQSTSPPGRLAHRARTKSRSESRLR